jgi:hypothetical protein
MREELKPLLTDAIRFWERARILYNALLAAISFGTMTYLLHGIGPAWRYLAHNFLLIFILVVIANIAYCAAYPVDTLVQMSDYQKGWRKGRWLLWGIGTAFSAALAVAGIVGLPKLIHG